MTKGHVLIADDEPGLVDVVRTNLEGYGYLVTTACDGEEALARTRQEKPDLIVLDVLMPKMDGWEVLRQIVLAPELRGIPVIMLTALGSHEHIIRGLETGAVHYMTKPFHPLDLVAVVRGNLDVSDPQRGRQRRRLLAERRKRLVVGSGQSENTRARFPKGERGNDRVG